MTSLAPFYFLICHNGVRSHGTWYVTHSYDSSVFTRLRRAKLSFENICVPVGNIREKSDWLTVWQYIAKIYGQIRHTEAIYQSTKNRFLKIGTTTEVVNVLKQDVTIIVTSLGFESQTSEIGVINKLKTMSLILILNTQKISKYIRNKQISSLWLQ